ncbi:MAG: zf-HC2 domain-containing protein [Acidobacteriaceae bacterium]|nr:zf-HC2 domain-containing protein [Acidobacteriaceae bacterium]
MFSKHVSSLLAAYIDGQLRAREARRVTLHLEHCEHCRRERELVESGMSAVEHLSLVHAPDAIWTAIEAALPSRPLWQTQRNPAWRFVFATLVFILLAGAGFWVFEQRIHRPGMAWELRPIQGTPVVNAKPVHGAVRVGAGEWIETNSSASVTVKLGEIGVVDIGPNTRLTLVTARPSENRLALVRGQIHAKISAPPKLFFVDTASGTAVDLGCEYSLHTDEEGSGQLDVTQGWVAFQWKGQESLVPAGASCLTLPKAGPGVPYFDDASGTFKRGVYNFAAAKFEGPWLEVILGDARVRDTLTLWHLLPRVGVRDRERIYSRMAALAPVPAGISRAKVLRLDPETLKRWKDELAWVW